MKKSVLVLFLSVLSIVGCSGIKVINPNEENNAGTLAVDASGGQLKLVATYTCKLDSMGNRFSAVGKTEDEARKEVVARCHDRTLFSVCESDKVKCVKN
ncbi:hypothetical protein [Bdellovibrio svalbardensis]|uniref:Lipoprotein n=1 Tax=Bdellovibrio svalbardensis TaxID=2972972 RepID=A0ABT6DHC1_9BACT|nr:hypothetical protein [Bdellovibrio svalbardensis]MDG0816262.1 hypothetical protein [Bdellovibrio svalbardensis]